MKTASAFAQGGGSKTKVFDIVEYRNKILGLEN